MRYLAELATATIGTDLSFESITLDERMESLSPSKNVSSSITDFDGGMEWMIDASGCDASRLRDLVLIESICRSVIRDLELVVVGIPLSHLFPGAGGVTAMYLLSESHLACHTYPEREFATFNLYCCRERPAWDWQSRLADGLGATSVLVRRFDRRCTDKPSLGKSSLGARR